MNIAVAPTMQGEETLVRLIRNEFGVELVALDDARAAGDSPAGQLATLEDLCRLGRPAPSEEGTKTRAVDALSGPEKRAFTRRVSLITHCDRLFIEAAKGAKKRENIFKQAALAEFDDAEKPANVDPAKEQPSPPGGRLACSGWRNTSKRAGTLKR